MKDAEQNLGGDKVAVVKAGRLVPRRVWKYEVPRPNSESRSYVRMEDTAEIISVGVQNDQLVVWALVPLPMDYSERELVVANTSDQTIPFPAGARFLGTVIASTGIVWHVWEALTRATLSPPSSVSDSQGETPEETT